MTQNPWTELPLHGPDFVLAQDDARVRDLNRRAPPAPNIDTTLWPEPFLGRKDAPVVLLSLNPGWSPLDGLWYAKEQFKALARANLLQQDADYPFYLLNPRLKDAPGSIWWNARLRHLIGAVGRERVARGLLCVERFPYHSPKFGAGFDVPSQVCSDHLVRTALQRGALVVGMRARHRWETAVPQLAQPGVVWLNSPQATYLTPGNFPDKPASSYGDLVRRLEQL